MDSIMLPPSAVVTVEKRKAAANLKATGQEFSSSASVLANRKLVLHEERKRTTLEATGILAVNSAASEEIFETS